MHRATWLCLLEVACGSPGSAGHPPAVPSPPVSAPTLPVATPVLAPPVSDLPALVEGPGTACGHFGTNLRELLRGPGIAHLVDAEVGGRHFNPTWATSHRAVRGTYVEPKVTAENRDEVAIAIAKMSWPCRYAPGRAADDDRATAWCEGVDGPGVGQVLVVSLGTGSNAVIWNGWQKSEFLRVGSSRPKDVRVTLLESRGTRVGHAELGSTRTIGPIGVLGSVEATLLDLAGPQPLPLPTALRTPGTEALVGIEILSTYAGARYDDTCIGDVIPVAQE